MHREVQFAILTLLKLDIYNIKKFYHSNGRPILSVFVKLFSIERDYNRMGFIHSFVIIIGLGRLSNICIVILY